MNICFIDTVQESQFDVSTKDLVDKHDFLFAKDIPANCDIIIGGMPSKEQLLSANKLKALIIPYSGLLSQTRANILETCPDLPVYNIKHNATAVAEMALTLLLSAKRNLLAVDQDLRTGNWSARFKIPTNGLVADSKITILGYGAVGKKLASILSVMGAEVHVVRNSIDTIAQEDGLPIYPPQELRKTISGADALIICCPLTEQTRGMIQTEHIHAMNSSSCLVYVARSEIVDEAALYSALQTGHLAHVGLDVWPNFPMSKEQIASTMPSALPFHELPQVIMSPHRAGMFAGNHILR